MKERRNHERIMPSDVAAGEILLSSDIDLIDISPGGAHFICTKRASVNSPLSLVVHFHGKDFHLKGTVIRSQFRGSTREEEKVLPIYEIALQFRDPSESQIRLFSKLVKSEKEGK